MVPQLLPPVAATTIDTPTQKAPSDRNPAAVACGAASVYILFCAISFVAPPIPTGTWNTHTFNVENRCYLQTRAHTPHGCMRVDIHQGNREKTRCQLQNRSCLAGEGEPGRLPARAASRQCSFLKTLGRAGLGEWLFKTLGSFYFTTMEANSALKCQSKWSHLVSAGSLCILAVEVRPDKSRKVQLKLFFLPIKTDSTEELVPGLINFFLWKDNKVTGNLKDTGHWNECYQRWLPVDEMPSSQSVKMTR